MPDQVAASSLVRCGWASGCHYAKVTGILVYFEACLAIAVAIAGSFAWLYGDRDQSSLDMFLFVVGIVFVHDVDEKIWLVWTTLRQTGKQYDNFSCIFWIVALTIGTAFFFGIFFALGGRLPQPSD